ncbi:MAG: HD domain-containing phosphohydrolase [Chloroflexota bacterium]
MIKPTILIVDDTPEDISILSGILRETYRVKVATSGERALKLSHAEPRPDIILLDVMMPHMSGYQVCRYLKDDLETSHIPVVFVTAMNDVEAETRGLEVGAVDYIAKPFSPPIVLARLKTQLALHDQNRMLEENVRLRTAELNASRLEIIQRLSRAAEYKDQETGWHIYRIGHYARVLAQAIGLSRESADLMFNAAPMHDLGKIGIPDRILLKPGKLDPDERAIMQQHTLIGAEIIGRHDSDLLRMARNIALTHHEKWDGTGYPAGLKNDAIPLEGRIVAVVDVYDALTNRRPYKAAWPVEDAAKLIEQESTQYFDPGLVLAFKQSLPEILAIQQEYAENGKVQGE